MANPAATRGSAIEADEPLIVRMDDLTLGLILRHLDRSTLLTLGQVRRLRTAALAYAEQSGDLHLMKAAMQAGWIGMVLACAKHLRLTELQLAEYIDPGVMYRLPLLGPFADWYATTYCARTVRYLLSIDPRPYLQGHSRLLKVCAEAGNALVVRDLLGRRGGSEGPERRFEMVMAAACWRDHSRLLRLIFKRFSPDWSATVDDVKLAALRAISHGSERSLRFLIEEMHYDPTCDHYAALRTVDLSNSNEVLSLLLDTYVAKGVARDPALMEYVGWLGRRARDGHCYGATYLIDLFTSRLPR